MKNIVDNNKDKKVLINGLVDFSLKFISLLRTHVLTFKTIRYHKKSVKDSKYHHIYMYNS
jgi:hypothetical protein